jgi:uncharacterized repeat protein (TIGR01451 family)
LLLLFIVAIPVITKAQQSYGGTPLSFANKNLNSEIDRIVIPQPDMDVIKSEDEFDEKNAQMFKVGRIIPVDISLVNSGTWDLLADGTRVWRLAVNRREAKSLILLYKKFNLTQGCHLFLYNEKRNNLIGSFDYRNNPQNTEKYSTQMIQGETTYLELIIDPDCSEEPELEIEGVVYNYRGVESFTGYFEGQNEYGFGDSGSCNVNVNCSEGELWQDQKRGVALIFVINGFSAGFCSGSLINNTLNDGTPYFLTADHCGGDLTADDFAQWQFYFNFESNGCSNPATAPSFNTVIGSSFKARGPMNGGTDFLLLELLTDAETLSMYNAYFNGWDRTEVASPFGVTISHPSGDIKKISTYSESAITVTYPGCIIDAHWQMNWVETENGWGITEGGGSGGPVFNGTNGLIVGSLTGGASYCGNPVNSAHDMFGKIDKHWSANGTVSNRKLQPWLDPGNTGAITCSGISADGTLSFYVQGKVYNDLNQNCSQDAFEQGIAGINVLITPGDFITQTDVAGRYMVEWLPAGTYTVTVDTTTNNWNYTCNPVQNFTIINPDVLNIAPKFGMYSLEPCSEPNISISCPIMRRCFDNQQIFVQASNSNSASGILSSAYAEVQLNEFMTYDYSTIPSVDLGNNLYRFQLGDIMPGQAKSLRIDVTISCDAILDQTLCMQANLFPLDDCVLDDNPNIPGGPDGDIPDCLSPWDHSSLSVEGWCENDSVYFTVTNIGEPVNGDMDCQSPVRLFIDGVLIQIFHIQLSGGQVQTFGFEATGQTFRLEADQHPLHPGNSYPNAVVELCGDLTDWTPGMVDNQYQDDADPIKDIFCGQITGSYDPNDKAVSPCGTGEQNNIVPGQTLQYLIRFQNTGNDTAFTVVIRDTLDINLNLLSVNSGVASHDYSFRIVSPRVLEWTFNNILLPDSTTNEPESHGFVTFSVSQVSDLEYGTIISNTAAIYFDYNDPVITNTVFNTIYQYVPIISESQSQLQSEFSMLIFPNPTKNMFEILLEDNSYIKQVEIFSVTGEIVKYVDFGEECTNYSISSDSMSEGVYFVVVKNDKQTFTGKLIITK